MFYQLLEEFKRTNRCSFSLPHSVPGMVGKQSREFSSRLLEYTPRKSTAGIRADKIGTRNDGSTLWEE